MTRNSFAGSRPLRDMTQTERSVMGEKFFVHLAGKTNNAHQELVGHLRNAGQTEVSVLEDSDYLLVFCPIASRVGTDISEALENMPGGKEAILVVMHHTFNPDHVVAPSNRQVTNPKVFLTVDCLFYEGKLLQTCLNEIALHEITKSLGVSYSPRSSWKTSLAKMLRVPWTWAGDSSRLEKHVACKSKSESVALTGRDRHCLPVKSEKAMQETLPTNYQSIPDMTQTERTVMGEKFFVHLAGKTNNAHQELVGHLRNAGQTEVSVLEDSDYLLVFCPIASRVGTDISEALENMPGGKKAILVVMHHTFNPDHVVAPSNRQVTNPKVFLTVDCLFYEGKLLQTCLNEIALHEITKSLGVSYSPRSSWRTSLAKMLRVPWTWAGVGAVTTVLLVVVFTVIIVEMNKNSRLEKHVACKSKSESVALTGRDRHCLPVKSEKAMQETLPTNYQSIPDMTQTERSVMGKKFFVHLAGKTNNAHQELVGHLRNAGQVEVSVLEDSDYLLVFCPIASRVGTDISEALENMPGGKKAILVVMHHTFNPDHVVAPSNRQVTNPKVFLTVDCLFYEGKLLQSNHTEIALHQIMKSLGVSYSPSSSWRTSLAKMQRDPWIWAGVAAVTTVILVVVFTVVIVEMNKK
ncbi:uncharacterized protein si:ch211-245h14.1 isoform X5 [Epinephelus fuscoguttatus]|uniref:uncharacterized protein si:ch211-245h14.1 isoform X5 n=1 Tax=Epinephelus fuscoguttatus TaxID=293821 RepID=UPI0020D16A8E|nr:uncharacterized protein si:ch211-245h14.1 isoform X5 [Epinephelus fuscoguttatus]